MPRSKEIVELIQSGDIRAAKKSIGKLCAETTGCMSATKVTNSTQILQNAVLAASTLPDTTLLQYLLGKGVSVNFSGATRAVVSRGGGLSPLHVAVASGAHDALEVLLRARCDVGVVDSRHGGNTALHVAAGRCDGVAARMLLRHGADVRALNAARQTPLQVVSRYGHVELVRLLLLSGAEVYQAGQRGASPMHIAAAEGHVPLLDLFSHSADVNIKVRVKSNGVGCIEQAPLHSAAENAQLQTVCFLIDKLHANVNVLDSTQRTPLHVLLSSRHSPTRCVRPKQDHVATSELLLSRGVDVNLRDVNGQTALHLAVLNQFHGAAKALLLYGADGVIKDNDNKTPRDCVAEDDVVGRQIFENHVVFVRDLSPPAYEETERPAAAESGGRCYNCHGAINKTGEGPVGRTNSRIENRVMVRTDNGASERSAKWASGGTSNGTRNRASDRTDEMEGDGPDHKTTDTLACGTSDDRANAGKDNGVNDKTHNSPVENVARIDKISGRRDNRVCATANNYASNTAEAIVTDRIDNDTTGEKDNGASDGTHNQESGRTDTTARGRKERRPIDVTDNRANNGKDSGANDGKDNRANNGKDSGANDEKDNRANHGKDSGANDGRDNRANNGKDSGANGGKDKRANNGKDSGANDGTSNMTRDGTENRSSVGKDSKVNDGTENIANDGTGDKPSENLEQTPNDENKIANLLDKNNISQRNPDCLTGSPTARTHPNVRNLRSSQRSSSHTLGKAKVKQRLVLSDGRVIVHTVPKARASGQVMEQTIGQMMDRQ